MTYNIGDEITIRVSEAVQSAYDTAEVVSAFVTDIDMEDPEQPYRFRVGNSGPFGSWLEVSQYEIIATPAANNDLDISQVLVNYAANRLTLSEAVTNLKGLNA